MKFDSPLTHLTTDLPDEHGHFGQYGGAFVAETLISALNDLTGVWKQVVPTETFQKDFHELLESYAGRPTRVTFARRLTEYAGGARIYLKREDLLHTGAHKINNCIGQVLLAKYLGKQRLIAETGAGQHGVATATVAAHFGLPCTVFMGQKDVERQRLNVFRMRLLGAEVIPVEKGTRTLKDALNEALRHWVATVDDTFYVIGSVAGPHPYPAMVRDFQSVIGVEARAQMIELTGKPPDLLVASVGGGSNAIGLFWPFLSDFEVKMVGVEAAGAGLDTQHHAATLAKGRVGVLHGAMSVVLQDEFGQTLDTHSISAGLDYPGVGPEHAWLRDQGRVQYDSITDAEALDAFQLTAQREGILPALESSHAIAYALKAAAHLPKTASVLVNLSGRGDKDVHTVANALGTSID